MPSVRWFFSVWIILASITTIYSPPTFSNNALSQELSKNGIWLLFSAFRNNQLDYRQFYPVIDKKLAFELLHHELIEPNSVFFNDNSMEWRRYIHSNSPEKHLNVITIVVESLGSVSLGDRTPHLNDLSKKCLYFTNMKATGTRTVRGLEAIILSLPPTPGASIVRRPNNHNLFNTGTLFRQRGYDTVFIYGGYGYFDNMNEFFSGNGFRIIDRSTIPDEYKTFTNAWGICDEDLFDAVIREADIAYTSNKPFYHVALTTSNHRPFTYPNGRVEVPSGTSRTGAIKYTDYAIHRFLKEAKKKPWFSDTIFIIVADHTAGSAGKTVLPPDNYDIPCFIYSPAHIKSQKIDTLCCQLDIAPTLFSLLNWNYSSSFFGKNILTLSKNDGRAWIGTYQLLGYLTEKELVILEPLKNPIIESFLSSYTTATNKSNSILIQQAIAVYQTAQELFTQGKLKENMLSTPDEIILSTSQ
ncbi:LTA synthase family protein [Lawsonia intracellularis]|uniref:LTA synthase family protein n=1 Tax=Lawsonia intracellularis TaxID=29546 RepID=UPI00214AAB1A|nr:LTA synthase family protein [Lawsonia intracellularis]